MRPRSASVAFALLPTLLLLLFGPDASATQEARIVGEANRVEGQRVRIEIESELWPRVGDIARLAYHYPDYDELVYMAGHWRVSEVTPEHVWAEPLDDVPPDTAPAPGYVVEIDSPNPQPRPAAAGPRGGGSGAGTDAGAGDLNELARMYEALLAFARGDASRDDIIERARTGDPEAQNQVGVYYVNGDGVEQSYEEAARWYRLAAEQGFVWSMVNLGFLYEYGQGVPQDHAQAVRWFRSAADVGFDRGQRALGFMYQRGVGVPQDLDEAMRLYRLAAAQDNADAHNDIGVLYENGWGVPQDYVQAMSWYRSAADLGLHAGYYNIAELYEHGLGVERNYNEAIRHYQQAARLGYEPAREWLRGRGISW